MAFSPTTITIASACIIRSEAVASKLWQISSRLVDAAALANPTNTADNTGRNGQARRSSQINRPDNGIEKLMMKIRQWLAPCMSITGMPGIWARLSVAAGVVGGVGGVGQCRRVDQPAGDLPQL
jgi:hypothetical protein